MNCPICKAEVNEHPRPGVASYLPFCSERCKLIDLGRWLGDKYQIPVRPDERDDVPADPRHPPALDDEGS